MWVYVVRRLLLLPFMLAAISLITFTLGRYGPGDPVEVMLGNKYDPVVAARLRASLGLDRSFFVQYGSYMGGVLHGDFGESIRYRGRSVGSLIGSKIWVSVRVNAAAMIVSLGLGLPLGFWIAHKQGSWKDPSAVAVALVLMSIPVMVTIPFMLWVGCLKLGWIPCSGWGGFWDPRIIVPAITLGVPGVAGLARLMRSTTLEVLAQDFIRTARAKGLSGYTVDYRHVFKNAMIPIVTILAFSMAGILTTSFIVERILGIPGVGNFMIESIFNRDYPVIMAVVLIVSSAFILANLVADVAYAFIDPRIRYT